MKVVSIMSHLLAFAAATAFTDGDATAQTATGHEKYAMLSLLQNSTLCAAIPGGHASEGMNVILRSCDQSALSQIWILDLKNSHIRSNPSVGSSLCLTMDRHPAKKSAVQLMPCQYPVIESQRLSWYQGEQIMFAQKGDSRKYGYCLGFNVDVAEYDDLWTTDLPCDGYAWNIIDKRSATEGLLV
eukprot:TRINITY_DN84095_c0_g1_i1.p1 TRINITY_DN84095_c0_g1~~TRINITY_DN84095_c0_g1_i1.p1  ORF type:complete len:185 (+),score=17.06 TRINITY_DN84095_c0_g1_i1:67-621(+)